MTDAVSNVIKAAVQIRQMCERAKACRALVDVVERKMASLIPVMAEIQNHLEEMDTTAVMHLATALAKDIRECRAIVQRASQMSKISYIVHSNDLREQIERNLRAIHLALMSLQASQSTYLIHQNQRLAEEFRKFHVAWQQREKELRREKERESRLKARVAKSLEECNQQGASDQARRESVAKAAGINVSQVKWLERELIRARADHDKLVAKMKRDKDSVARSKAKADAMFMDQIITALAINESLNTAQDSAYMNPAEEDDTPIEPIPVPLAPEEGEEREKASNRNLPEDCFCPITNQVMNDPVIVDANCHHTMSRDAAQQWFGLGKTTCPVCGIEIGSHHLSPNVQLRNVTESLLSDGFYMNADTLSFMKCTRENTKSFLNVVKGFVKGSSLQAAKELRLKAVSCLFFFVMLSAGVALSIMTIWSCSFLDSGVLGARQSGVGLYRYVDDAGTCWVYPDDFSFTMSDQTARVCGLIAPIIAAGAGLLVMIQLFCCNICCDRCFISCFFTSAQIAQTLTFFMFNGSFCTVGLSCSLSLGSYYSMAAWGSYFVASVVLCCSRTYDPAIAPLEIMAGDIESAIPERDSPDNENSQKSKHYRKESTGFWGDIFGGGCSPNDDEPANLWKRICTPPIVGAIAIWCLVLGAILFGLFSNLRASTNQGIQSMKVFGLVILCLGGFLIVAYGKLIVDRYLDRIEHV